LVNLSRFARLIWSLTDICCGWTSLRAVWNKGAHGIVEATRDVE
jgi:hypothetical protein